MRRLSRVWTAVGSALAVFIGAGLGGLELVDFNTMLGITLLPQLGFILYGRWPVPGPETDESWQLVEERYGYDANH